jgi:superfamily II DNA helicase RecQ
MRVYRQPDVDGALKVAAKKLWGDDACFYEEQAAAIKSGVVDGNHVFACWPTAGGKSGVYQGLGSVSKLCGLPSGVLYIAPLIALVEDQAMFLTSRGFTCKVLHGGSAALPTEASWSADFVFVTPEAVLTGGKEESAFYQALGKWKEGLAFGVVDEAHLASEWYIWHLWQLIALKPTKLLSPLNVCNTLD